MQKHVHARFMTNTTQTRRSGMTILFILLSSLLFLPQANAQVKPTPKDSITVDEIEFAGNSSFSSSDLQKIIRTKPSYGAVWVWLYDNLWGILGDPQEFFDYSLYEEDAAAIAYHYKHNGFLESKVEKSFEFLPDSTSVRVVFAIEEGKSSAIDSVNYRNLERLPPGILAAINADPILKVGERVQSMKIKQEEKRILDLLHDNGFPRAYCDSIIVERKLSNNSVIIKMPFYYGKQLLFGDIKDSVQGTEELNISNKMIRGRLDFTTGDPFSTRKMEAAESAILRYKIFQQVKLEADIPSIGDTVTTRVPVTIILEPRKRYEFIFAPVAQYKLNRLYLGIEPSGVIRNPFGSGVIVMPKVSVLTGLVGQDIKLTEAYQYVGQVQFEQPYFVDRRTSAYLTFSASTAKEPGWNFNQGSGAFGIRRTLTDNISLNPEYMLERLDYRLDSGSVLQPIWALMQNGDSSRTQRYANSIISVALDFNYTNDFFNPSGGFAVKLGFEEAGLLYNLIPKAFSGFKSTEYLKAEALFRKFSDLSQNRTLLFGCKLKVGAIHPYGQSRGEILAIPFNRRYYAGGSIGNRGWLSRKLAFSKTYQDIGSNTLIESSVELRWQLFPTQKFWVLPIERIWSTFFIDAGNLWDTFGSVSLPTIAVSGGIGIGLMLPFGPIRGEYGYRIYDPLNPDGKWADERPFSLKHGALQFGFGWSF